MSAKIINGREIAKDIRKKTAEELRDLVSKYKTPPNITTVKIGSDPSSDMYLRLRDNACEEVGIRSNHLEFPNDVSENNNIVFGAYGSGNNPIITPNVSIGGISWTLYDLSIYSTTDISTFNPTHILYGSNIANSSKSGHVQQLKRCVIARFPVIIGGDSWIGPCIPGT